MNCLIIAFDNQQIKIFLTKEKFEQKEQVCCFCKNKQIEHQVCDFHFYQALPEPAFLDSLYVEDSKIKVNRENLFKQQFNLSDVPIIENLLQVNQVNTEKAKENKDKKSQNLFAKNEQYLKSLTSDKIYTEQGKVNPFYNIGELYIAKAGSGYKKDIQVTVSAPNTKAEIVSSRFGSLGKTAKISCTQKDGKLANIFVEDGGCGYFEAPVITFSEPDDANGEKPEVEIFPLNYITFDDTSN